MYHISGHSKLEKWRDEAGAVKEKRINCKKKL